MDWDLHQQKLWKNKKTGVVAFLVVIQGPKVRTMACIETRECQNVSDIFGAGGTNGQETDDNDDQDDGDGPRHSPRLQKKRRTQ